VLILYRVQPGDTGLYLLLEGETATGSRFVGDNDGTSSVLSAEMSCFGRFAVVKVSKIGLCCLSAGDESCGDSTPSSISLMGEAACQSGGGGASRLMP